MEVTVTMSAQDFVDFIEWRKLGRPESSVLLSLAVSVLSTVVDCSSEHSSYPEYCLLSDTAAQNMRNIAAAVLDIEERPY